jgi:hypothetical protein
MIFNDLSIFNINSYERYPLDKINKLNLISAGPKGPLSSTPRAKHAGR